MTLKDLLELTDASMYVEVRAVPKDSYIKWYTVYEDYCEFILKSIHKRTTNIGDMLVDIITLSNNENSFYNTLIVYIKEA